MCEFFVWKTTEKTPGRHGEHDWFDFVMKCLVVLEFETTFAFQILSFLKFYLSKQQQRKN